jgi:hypothetical protein
VTYAATTAASPKPTYASACANANHTLQLIKSGKCPHGDSSIKLGLAPTPLNVVATNATRTATAGNFVFVATCRNSAGGQTAKLALTSTKAYVVQGSDVFVNDGGDYSTPSGAVTQAGAGQISFAASNPLTSTFTVADQAGVTGNLLVIQSGHTEAVTFAIFAYGTDCSVQAQIAASS